MEMNSESHFLSQRTIDSSDRLVKVTEVFLQWIIGAFHFRSFK